MSAIYTKDSVTSSDGTTIGYRQLGRGPGLILVHGGMKSSQDFMKLAGALSDAFTVYLPDRRGRGLSGPHGSDFGVMREVDDLQALIVRTGARYMFGLSAGGLVVLKTASITPALEKVSLYEPPLSIGGSVPIGWVPRYEREITEGKLATAVVTALKGIGTEALFNKLPRWLLVPFMALIMKVQGESAGDDVTIRSLIPTMHFDLHVAREMADTLPDYRSLRIPALLMGGTTSPPYLGTALGSLAATLPRAQRKTFAGLGHDGPEDDGRPDLIAEELRQFFHAG